jgi:hypothetical protein
MKSAAERLVALPALTAGALPPPPHQCWFAAGVEARHSGRRHRAPPAENNRTLCSHREDRAAVALRSLTPWRSMGALSQRRTHLEALPLEGRSSPKGGTPCAVDGCHSCSP